VLQRWRKPITVVLTPECVVINSGKKASRVIELKTSMADKSSWSQALAELEKNAATIASCRVRFILSNHYVRYAVLPWQSDIYLHQDWQSLAENYLRTVHGNVVDDWKVSVAMQGYQNPLIVSAIDNLLVTQLEQLVTQFKWTLESIEPAFMSVLNHYHHKIKNNDCLMMIEPRRTVLAEITKGCLASFTIACPPTEQDSMESTKLIKRIRVLNNNKQSTAIHLFGEQALQPKGVVENMAISSLSEHAEHSVTALMLAELA